MSYRRLYFLGPARHISRFEESEVTEESDALARAERACAGEPAELWSCRSEVRRFGPERPPVPLADRQPSALWSRRPA